MIESKHEAGAYKELESGAMFIRQHQRAAEPFH